MYVPPMPRDLREVREMDAVASISMDDMVKVCDELELTCAGSHTRCSHC
jgi:signal recognition particle subunit SEC65